MQFLSPERRGDPARGSDVSAVRGAVGRALTTAAVLGLLFAPAGCNDPEIGEGDRGNAPLPGDIPIVQNTADSALVSNWRVRDELRVGAVDGDAAFGRVADVAPRAAGGLWVVDAQSRWISGFAEDGSREVRFGGDGDGPGELRTPSTLFETEDGTVFVGSAFPPALHRFDAEGGYLGSSRLTESRDADGNPLPARFAVWQVPPDGRPLADLFAVPGPGQGPTVAHDLVRFGAPELHDSKRDTIQRWVLPATPASPSSPIELVPVRPSWSAGPEGLTWWAPGTPYEIRAYDDSGRPVRAITLDRAAIRVTRQIEERLIDGLRASAASGPGGAAVIEQAIERARWPKSLPHVAELWASHPDGRLFVLPWAADSFDESASRRLDVFEADGRYTGRLTLPPGFSPRRFANGFVYGVEEDEWGVQYAVRYAVGPGE